MLLLCNLAWGHSTREAYINTSLRAKFDGVGDRLSSQLINGAQPTVLVVVYDNDLPDGKKNNEKKHVDLVALLQSFISFPTCVCMESNIQIQES